MATTTNGVAVVTRYVVQDTWNDDDDQELREYLESMAGDSGDHVVFYLSESEIVEQTPRMDTMLFADTSLIQTLLRGKGIVDTYPEEFNHLYKRKITKTVLSSTNEEPLQLPYFIKLQGSNKEFGARVVRTPEEDEQVKTTISGEPVYICEVVDFVAEFRLFLRPTSVWAMAEYSEYMIGHRLQNSDGTDPAPLVVQHVEQVPNDFVQHVLEAAQKLKRFVVVDIGLTSTGDWSVVECNPPFALSSYDLDMKTYVDYCVLAWQHIVSSVSIEEETKEELNQQGNAKNPTQVSLL